ncbi:hypothetical protein KIM372_00710 [Bombiscardovia nodaiensis]|uniref:RCC1-like domain-containing protein n=1 Tax=Bombiscardovia nodaiensis TaxID=2932181 RepID=A0ABN6S9U4_9BIFI|nr:hypothetical protein KIM372_00710 [Bombiscardovia nodaiensis]
MHKARSFNTAILAIILLILGAGIFNLPSPGHSDPATAQSQNQAAQSAQQAKQAQQPQHKPKLQPRSSCVASVSTFRQCFPDINLASAMADNFGKGLDDVILIEFASSTSIINLNSKGISDLTGLDQFMGVEHLSLSGNNITDISPLFGLPGLVELNLSGNPTIAPYYTYQLGRMTNLRWLFLSNCNLSNDDLSGISGLSRLNELDLSHNNISRVDYLSGLRNLSTLNIAMNHISDVSPLSFIWSSTTFYNFYAYGQSIVLPPDPGNNPSRPMSLGPARNIDGNYTNYSPYRTSPAGGSFNRATGVYTWPITEGGVHHFYFDVDGHTLPSQGNYSFNGDFEQEITRLSVFFDANGGTAVSPVFVQKGQSVNQPGTSRLGYTLDGWFTDKTAGTKWNFSSPVMNNMTLYAHWTPIPEYIVTFKPGNGDADTTQHVFSGNKATAPANPTKGDSRFEGWYTADSGGRKWNFTGDTVTSNMTLYARWTDKYDVIFNPNGGTGTPGQQRVFSGEKASQPGIIPTKDHARFDGWFTAQDSGRQWNFGADTVSANTTLYAHWTTYTVHFDPQNGQTMPDQLAAPGETVNQPGTNPSKGDSRFEGWYTAASGGSKWNFGANTVTSNMTLYAQWTDKYDVIFDANGGDITPLRQRVYSGDHAIQPGVIPSKDHARFDGWFTAQDGGRQWIFTTDTVSANTTLYAHWTTYTVHFDPQNGQTIPDKLAAPGETVTAPSDPTNSDSRFDGWFTAANGGRKWNFTSDTVSATMTLYAHWTGRVTVSFDPNTGTGTPSRQRVLTGDHVGQPDLTPSKDHARLDGWFTAATGGRKWDFSVDTVSADTTLYAHWTTYTVHFDPQNGQTIPDKLAAPGETVTAPSDPAKGDSRFDGWFTATTGGRKWNFASNTVSADTTLYAHWTDRMIVSFYSNGGTPNFPSQRVLQGGTASRPTNPTRSGYQFAGWFTYSDQPWDFKRPVVSNVTLLAKWDSYDFTMTPDRGPKTGGTPIEVKHTGQPGVKFTQLTAGSAQSVALGSDGYVYAWGYNGDYELGDHTLTDSKLPIRVHTPDGITFSSIAAGYRHTLAIGSDGQVYAWGYDWRGQLGIGNQSSTVVQQFILPTGVNAVEVAAGTEHSLVLGDDGKIYASGSNEYHQIDDSSTSSIYRTPIAISAPGGGRFAHIAAGDLFSLATTDDGNLYAWGQNDYGQLGFSGTSTGLPRQVSLPAGVKITHLTAGNLSAAALTEEGDVYTWGENSAGQLGNGSWTSTTPAKITIPGGPVEQLYMGNAHALALTRNHQLYAWGSSSFGQVGNGSGGQINTPTLINPPGSAIFASIGTGPASSHSLAANTLGDMYAWGENYAGQLGDGGTTSQYTPQSVQAPRTDITKVRFLSVPATGSLNTSTGVWSGTSPAGSPGNLQVYVSWTIAGKEQSDQTLLWRYLDIYTIHFDLGGAPGSAPADQVFSEGDAHHATWPIVPIRAGYEFAGWFTPTGQPFDFTSPVRTSANLTARWDSTEFTLTPKAGLTTGGTHLTLNGPGDPGFRFTQVCAGEDSSVALGSNGLIYAWGNNTSNELGNESTVDSRTPVRVHTPAGLTFSSIAANGSYALAVGSDGKAYAWGNNSYRQLANGGYDNNDKPQEYLLPAGVRAAEVAAGYSHSLVLSEDGKVYAAGTNYFGEVANDTNVRDYRTAIPVNLPAGKTFVHIAAGKYFSLALSSDGVLYTWGYNNVGQLGNGNMTNHADLQPVSVRAGLTFTQIAARSNYAAAISDDGAVYTWGANSSGQLGTGDYVMHSQPTVIALPFSQRAASISTGESHMIALTTTGDMYAWGKNTYGQLGTGNLSDQLSPTPLSGVSGIAFATVSAGTRHSLAANKAGDMYAWGYNYEGQLGDGRHTDKRLATPVTKLTNTVSELDLDTAATTGLTPAGTGVWNADSAPHTDSRVNVVVHWNHAGNEQTYTITKGYEYYTFASLMKAGSTPLKRYSGSMLLAGSTLAGLFYAGYELTKGRRKGPRHSLHSSLA